MKLLNMNLGRFMMYSGTAGKFNKHDVSELQHYRSSNGPSAGTFSRCRFYRKPRIKFAKRPYLHIGFYRLFFYLDIEYHKNYNQ